MHDPTLAAGPFSYSKTFQPSRAAARIARRTGLGCPGFVGLKAHAPAHKCFIRELILDTRQPGIERALCHVGLRQFGRVQIAIGIEPEFFRYLRRNLVLPSRSTFTE